ncbi:DUF4345 domain-containing protein [Cellulomonas sp. URHB0016]
MARRDDLGTRATLVTAGLVAVVVGAAGLLAPEALRAATGGAQVTDVAVLSDLRGATASVLAAGLFLLLALARPRLASAALLVGGGAYLSYACGRTVGLLLDGWPGTNVLVAGAVELALGALCVGTWLRTRHPRGSS